MIHQQNTPRAVTHALVPLLAALAFAGCNAGEPELDVSTTSERVEGQGTEFSCGYEVDSGTYATWTGGFQAWVEVQNVEGEIGTDFQVLIDIGNAQITDGYQAEYSAADGGYLVDAPSWLQYQKIPDGQGYRFAFIASGAFEGITAYVISINEETCDQEPPAIELSASKGLFTSDDVLTLTAEATDNVAVRKVVFEQDGEFIGEDWEPPYEIDVDIDDGSNGRHVYTATAIDPTGNSASDTARVLVAIGNRYVGTAVAAAGDYDDLLTYFNSLTPGNAGKWGVVEGTRDQMNWDELDTAHDFAEDNGIGFRMHTLIWGQQQPGWIGTLPAEEQLEEIEEWMAAVAARYDDIASIDVVNEPLHSVPNYAEALGGAGVTGYDWVIKAFELAREYFPNSELVLNDYQVLLHQDFTAQYLPVIEALQQQDLIDGIGVQGHFLERAELSQVENNLATLAATGLPIYVTEFDVNFQNDARHANVYSELFSIFWDNPSVLGVTNWGHAQGATWQPNTWLIDQNGNPRPALEWLVCYVGGGEDCPLPEYTPEPFIGDDYGVTLEAELWDEAEGVLALGDSAAYTDDGDWLSFSTVVLEDEWDTLWVTYAKGNEAAGSISIILDELENEPWVTVELPPTAGWGTKETIELNLDPVAGNHAVYVRFNDTYGVANLDKIRIGTPAPNNKVEILPNGDFEDNSNGWYTWNGATVGVSTDRAHSGSQSLVVSGGTGTGPAATDLTGLVEPGNTYDLSFWVNVDLPEGITGTDVRLTVALGCEGGTSYLPIASNGAVAEDVWVNLAGSVTIDESCGTVSQFQPYVEGDGGGVVLYVDDVSVLAPLVAPNLVTNSDFETDTSGWYSWAATLSVSTDRAHTGSSSLLAVGGGTGPAATSLTSAVEAGKTYDFSFWVSVDTEDDAPTDVRATLALGCGGSTSYNPIASNAAVPDSDDFVELAGSFTIPEGCVIDQFQPYVEGDGANVGLYVDDVSIREQLELPKTNLIANGEFESDTSGWYSWAATLSVTSDRAHAGSQSLLATGAGTGPAATNLTSQVEAGQTYDFSFWVNVGLPEGVTSTDVRLTLALGCGGSTSYVTIDSNGAVGEDEWVELAGSYTIGGACVVDQFQPYVEGNGSDIDLYVDSVFIGY